MHLPWTVGFHKARTPVPLTRNAENEEEQWLEDAIVDIFAASRNNYGTRKIKVKLRKRSLEASRRKIGQIMNKHGLVSNYSVAQYKPLKSDSNESAVKE